MSEQELLVELLRALKTAELAIGKRLETLKRQPKAA